MACTPSSGAKPAWAALPTTSAEKVISVGAATAQSPTGPDKSITYAVLDCRRCASNALAPTQKCSSPVVNSSSSVGWVAPLSNREAAPSKIADTPAKSSAPNTVSPQEVMRPFSSVTACLPRDGSTVSIWAEKSTGSSDGSPGMVASKLPQVLPVAAAESSSATCTPSAVNRSLM